MPGVQQSRARVARRIATAAAYGGGGLGLLGAGLAGLVITESRLAVRAIGLLEGDPPKADGVYGTDFADPGCTEQEPVVLALLGDSTAVGLGVRRSRETPGALLATGLAAVAERPVRLVNVAVSGARSDDLGRQVRLASVARPQVAVIIIGANDVTRRTPAAQAVRHLGEAVRDLSTLGCEVVVATCPDLGTIKPVRPPLRWLVRRVSRQLAAAQTIAVVESGGRTVSLGSLLGPEFAARPEMFASDRFHPSAQGYATAAMAVLPSLCAALDLWPQAEAEPPARREAVLPMAVAAATAAGQSGTEVAAGAVGAGGRRWALVKHRLRLGLPGAEGVAPSAADPTTGPSAGTAGTAGTAATTATGTALAAESANSQPSTDDVRAT
ncbi:SGNH/GDSL hydrolase family protein [Kitasatospora sp. LaBMicrA B282]|uniref:SGNH/GDSL hydrolase family protein n=1 Tax=Kitasatospora sp. LaBMicrA B282 TaxID=3420949 RepID=UPI003D0BA379